MTLIIGIGHPFRRDDGLGPTLAEAVGGLVHHGEGMDLMERWAGQDRVVLIDATCSGEPAGTIRVFDAAAADLPSGLFPKGSHLIGPAEGIAMARLLGRLPAWLMVLGVEGADFSTGQGFSPAVAAAMPAARAELDRLIRAA